MEVLPVGGYASGTDRKKKIKYERKDPVVGKSKPQDLFVCFAVKEITVKIRRIYRNI